jgi:hypothetical protein
VLHGFFRFHRRRRGSLTPNRLPERFNRNARAKLDSSFAHFDRLLRGRELHAVDRKLPLRHSLLHSHSVRINYHQLRGDAVIVAMAFVDLVDTLRLKPLRQSRIIVVLRSEIKVFLFINLLARGFRSIYNPTRGIKHLRTISGLDPGDNKTVRKADGRKQT